MDNYVLGTLNLATLENPHEHLDNSWKRGFYRYDLARTYGLGKSEKVFGEWRSINGISRESVDLVTKGGMGKDKYGHPDREPCSLAMLSSEIRASLEALKTDYVDLYMYHRDDPRIPVQDFVDWMNELYNEGLIKKWGVSNWNWERVKEASAYAKANGLQPPTATSPQLSLAVPKGQVWPSTHSLSCPTQQNEMDWYHDNGIQVLGWETLAKGFMAVPDQWSRPIAKNTGKPKVGSDAWRLQRLQNAYCTPENYRRREEAVKIAKAHDLTLAQVALLYALNIGPHVSVLVGAGNPRHLDEMTAIRDVNIKNDLDGLARLSHRLASVRPTYPVGAASQNATVADFGTPALFPV